MSPARILAPAIALAVSHATVASAEARGPSVRQEVSFAVSDYARAVNDGAASLATLRDWPAQKFPGVDLSLEIKAARGRRLPYDIVAVVGSRDACEAAVNAAFEDSQEVTIGRLLLSPYELKSVQIGKGRSWPSARFCMDQFYPLTVRFTRDVMLREQAVPRGPER